MRYGFCRKSGYTKRLFMADVFLTMKAMKFSVSGKLLAELIEVVFATLQQGLLQRGTIILPSLGEIRIRIIDGQPKFFFEPSAEVTRRLRAALAEAEDED